MKVYTSCLLILQLYFHYLQYQYESDADLSWVETKVCFVFTMVISPCLVMTDPCRVDPVPHPQFKLYTVIGSNVIRARYYQLLKIHIIWLLRNGIILVCWMRINCLIRTTIWQFDIILHYLDYRLFDNFASRGKFNKQNISSVKLKRGYVKIWIEMMRKFMKLLFIIFCVHKI